MRIKARQIGCSTFASCLAPLEVEALKINPQKSQSAFSRLLDRPYKKLVSQSVHNCSCIQGYLKVQWDNIWKKHTFPRKWWLKWLIPQIPSIRDWNFISSDELVINESFNVLLTKNRIKVTSKVVTGILCYETKENIIVITVSRRGKWRRRRRSHYKDHSIDKRYVDQKIWNVEIIECFSYLTRRKTEAARESTKISF